MTSPSALEKLIAEVKDLRKQHGDSGVVTLETADQLARIVEVQAKALSEIAQIGAHIWETRLCEDALAKAEKIAGGGNRWQDRKSLTISAEESGSTLPT